MIEESGLDQQSRLKRDSIHSKQDDDPSPIFVDEIEAERLVRTMRSDDLPCELVFQSSVHISNSY